MTPTSERIRAELLTLSVRERAELARFLIQSLDQDTDEDAEAAWDVELARRAGEIKRSEAIGIPAEEMFAKLRQKDG
jgi:putative addiction module component (TIGR02574 family)